MTDPLFGSRRRIQREQALFRLSWITAWVAVAAATLVLIGWMLDIRLMKSAVPGLATMKANTAVGLMAIGASCAQLHRASRPHAFIIGCAALVFLLGAASLAQYATGVSLGIDELLFEDDDPSTRDSAFPGRMSVGTALCFMLVGSALWLLTSRAATLWHVADAAIVTAGLIGVVALAGYVYEAPALYRVSIFNSMAVHTAALFAALAAALLATPPIRGIAKILTGDDIGAGLARSLLPVALFAPPLIGWLRLIGQQQGLYGTEFGIALFATANVLIFAAVIFRAATSMRAADLRRRQSAAALQESERRFRLLADNARDYAIVILDSTGHITSWNQGAQRLNGYRSDEILGAHFNCLYAPEDVASGTPAQQLEDATDAGSFEVEGWRVRKDGSRFWASVVITPLKDEHGQLQGFGKITRDITERKRTEAVLRDERSRLAGLIDSAMDGVVTVDAEQRITLFNPAAERMFGLPAREMMGKRLEQLMPARYRDGHADHVRGFRETGVSSRRMGALGQVWGIRANGDEFPVEAAISQIEVNGQPFFTAILRDITERKRAEEARIANERRLRTITDSLTEGLVIASANGDLLYWNKASRTMFGFAPDDALFRTLPSFIDTFQLSTLDGRVLGVTEWPLARVVGGEQLRDLELRLRVLRSGRELTLSFSGEMVLEDNNQPVAFLSFSDITQRKRDEDEIRLLNASLELRVRERTEELMIAKERAETADRSKSLFLANMSHELRTPLNAIIGFSELIRDGKVTPAMDVYPEFVSDIATSGRHLLHLINDVLDLSKVEAGKTEFHASDVDLSALVAETVGILRAVATDKQVKVGMWVDPDLTGISIDAVRLKQVLYNFLSNALKFTPAGGRVTLRVTPEPADSAFRVEVEDTGIGIAADDLGKLFVPFQQLETGATKRHAGTGLGLSLTKRLVEAQGGSVGVRSTLGKGSVFHAVLPRRAREPDPSDGR
jgi:PAS domain S-box-containing protein